MASEKKSEAEKAILDLGIHTGAEGAEEKTASNEKKASGATKPQRSFPTHSIESALAIARAIAEHNAGNPWGSEQVASAMNMGAKASNFYYLTAASRDYGFTTGTSRRKTIELTALGRKAIYPENGGQEYSTLLQAFENVDVFKRVFEYYQHGALPEKRYLYNTLQEVFGIHPDHLDEFYQIYTENVKFLSEKRGDGAVPRQSYPGLGNDGENQPLTAPGSKELFIIMPFSEKTDKYPEGYFEEVFNSLIVPAASEAGYTARTASKNGSDIIHKTIVNSIYNAEIILADLTEHNPNVLFELGLAIAFKKKVAIIRAKGTPAIFDVNNSIRVLDYSPKLWKSTLDMDIEKLAKHIMATSAGDEESYLDIFLSA